MRVKRLVPSIAMAILIAVGSGLVGPNLAHAAGKPTPKPKAAGITFGVQPATKGRPDARPNYRYAVTPAGAMVDQVAVRNLSLSPVTVRVYATDALNINNGQFGLLPRAQRPHDVGTWVTVRGLARDGTVTVKPRSVKVLTLSLKVPVKAQPGDHTGGIIASVTTLSKNEKKGTAANVELDQRVAVRLFVRVSGPLHPSLKVKPLNANYQNILNPFGRGATKVTYRITNTGNVNMGGRQRFTVKGLVGPTQALAIPDAAMLLPDGYMDVKTSLSQTWPLVHESATVTIKPLVLPGDLVAGKATYSAATSFWAVPWSLLALLVLIGVGLWFSRKVRRARSTGGTVTPVTEERQIVAGDAGATEAGATAAGISQRSARRLVASTSLTLAAMIAASGTATAAVVPYTDTNATGGITLCDAQGHTKTSGPVGGPLAATAVGGSAAVAPFNGDHRSAILTAYQPRKAIDPGSWSGQSMTGLSQYTNAKNPMVEILPRDYTLEGFLTGYPTQWDGLVQLRVYLKAPNQGIKNDTYAATTLKVTGSTWQQVGAAAGDVCKTGTAVSIAHLLGLPAAAPSTKPSGSGSTRPSGSGSTRPAGSGSTGTAAASSSSRPGASARTSTPSAVPSSADPSAAQASGALAKEKLAGASAANIGDPFMWVLSIALLAAAVMLWWFWNRRRKVRLDGA
jgi:hypothetical protein